MSPETRRVDLPCERQKHLKVQLQLSQVTEQQVQGLSNDAWVPVEEAQLISGVGCAGRRTFPERIRYYFRPPYATFFGLLTLPFTVRVRRDDRQLSRFFARPLQQTRRWLPALPVGAKSLVPDTPS